METKIKVSTSFLETVKPGDVVKSINYGSILLVIRATDNGRVFDGFVLDKGNYESYRGREFVLDLITNKFEPFIGTITLECE